MNDFWSGAILRSLARDSLNRYKYASYQDKSSVLIVPLVVLSNRLPKVFIPNLLYREDPIIV